MEQRIIEVARQVFIEKGFAETSMSDIAARVGINRPGLHYYFRTKERMFEAIFADLVTSFLPTIHQIALQDRPVSERIAEIVEVYFEVMQANPMLPVFIVREIQRDATHIFNTINRMEIGQYIRKIKEALQEEMASGKMRQAPMEFILYTFYGLLFAPFLSRPLTEVLFAGPDVNTEERMRQWKTQVTEQMCLLLCP